MAALICLHISIIQNPSWCSDTDTFTLAVLRNSSFVSLSHSESTSVFPVQILCVLFSGFSFFFFRKQPIALKYRKCSRRRRRRVHDWNTLKHYERVERKGSDSSWAETVLKTEHKQWCISQRYFALKRDLSCFAASYSIFRIQEFFRSEAAALLYKNICGLAKLELAALNPQSQLRLLVFSALTMLCE